MTDFMDFCLDRIWNKLLDFIRGLDNIYMGRTGPGYETLSPCRPLLFYETLMSMQSVISRESIKVMQNQAILKHFSGEKLLICF